MLTSIHLIIYDLDGVLVDTSDVICLSFNATLMDVGEAPYNDEEIHARADGPRSG
jgi:phosphoglycolate phosphatase-like HAD superfamily hydrolase